MCEQNKIDVPSSVDKLLNNQLGNRKCKYIYTLHSILYQLDGFHNYHFPNG